MQCIFWGYVPVYRIQYPKPIVDGITAAAVCAEDNVLNTNNDKIGIMTNAVILTVIVLFCYNANFNPWICTYKYSIHSPLTQT